jgi:tetratricopeptide (TPR) repeat protein
MFFPKLRRRAKWVFVFLAVSFAASFVLFGVGTGFGGLQDILLQERVVDGGPSEEEARERIEENPRDAQAYKDLATALQGKGELNAAVAPLAKYVEMRPNDVDAKRELAGLYLRQGDEYRTQAQIAQLRLQADVPGQTFQPPSTSKIGEALGTDPLSESLAERSNRDLNDALTKMQASFTRAVDVYKQIAQAMPRDPEVQFELAQTAEAANDAQTALSAYKRFLELAPEDPRADPVRDRVEQLESRIAIGAGG